MARDYTCQWCVVPLSFSMSKFRLKILFFTCIMFNNFKYTMWFCYYFLSKQMKRHMATYLKKNPDTTEKLREQMMVKQWEMNLCFMFLYLFSLSRENSFIFLKCKTNIKCPVFKSIKCPLVKTGTSLKGESQVLCQCCEPKLISSVERVLG